VVFSENIFIPPYRRKVGMVFQNYALWPHMNIFNNIAYPLKVKRFSKQEIHRRVGEILVLVQLEGLERRYPHELSGGQQQRAALARALVMEPRLLLLDEPLSNLDAKLREELREELKRVHGETGLTMLYVTHDQAEAMALADRIGVMGTGKLVQVGTPLEIYEQPNAEFVARFIGASNLVNGEVKDQNGQRTLELRGGPNLPLPPGLPLARGPTLLAIRPEEVIITRNRPGLSATIQSATYLGNAIEYRLRAGNLELHARTGPRQAFAVGERIFLRIRQVTPIGPRRGGRRMRGHRWRSLQ
jgi:iron(III) transport system ATP-binding protein